MANNKWILRPPRTTGAGPPQDKPSPPLRLFCIPQAGSGAWVYHEWQKHVPGGVEVLPIELPGRNTRMREQLVGSMTDLVSGIVQAIKPLLMDGTPYVIFGHSLGGWIAYALTQELQIQGYPLPCRIMVSGIRAPQLTGVAHDPDGIEMHKLGPSEFWEAMERRYGRNPDLVDPDVRKFVHPILASDFRVSETYQRVSSEPLPCPVFFSGGTDDPRIRKENVEAWKETVEKPEMCSIRWFNGGHNYLFNAKESKTEFLEYLTAQMNMCLERLATEKGPGPESRGTCNLENGLVKSPSSLPSSEPEPSELHDRSAPLGHPTPDCGASIQSGSDAGATVGSNSSYAIPSGTKVSTYSPPPLARINVENDVQTENTQDSEFNTSDKSVERKSFFRWLCGHG